MQLPTYFKDFLKDIRLTSNQISDLQTGHQTLRKRLVADETLSPIIVSTFLQGSYRRSTAVRPKNDSRSDVDVIVVTKLDKDEYTPEEALNTFIPFLEKHYAGKYRMQGRSIGITLSYVDLDIVPTSAPSESQINILKSEAVSSMFELEDFLTGDSSDKDVSALLESTRLFFSAEKNAPQWKSEPLLIPNREIDEWEKTHPLEQIRWTMDKNSKCNGHYINVVKALKWWRKEKFSEIKRPKSYPLEHFIGICCPDTLSSVADGVVLTLEKIVNSYPTKPFLPDHGIPEHDVFERISDDEYSNFYDSVCDAAKLARSALDSTEVAESANKWRELFGSKFPPPPSSSSSNTASSGFTPRSEKTESIPGGRFA